jgi:hypothetical protein
VGLVDKTLLPEPVDVVTPVPPLATGRVPVTPVVKGKPVTLVITPEAGVPRAGVTSVGLLAKTLAPVPVSSVNIAAKFALDGVAKNVAAPVARPDTPVEIGRPVAFVKVPEAGVPKVGVVNEGLVKCVFCCAKFVPSLQIVIVLPAGIATPVPAAVVLPKTVEL